MTPQTLKQRTAYVPSKIPDPYSVETQEVYEKPTIRRHAVIMTMAPAGSKMGHGLFPFATKGLTEDSYQNPLIGRSAYRR